MIPIFESYWVICINLANAVNSESRHTIFVCSSFCIMVFYIGPSVCHSILQQLWLIYQNRVRGL